MTPGKPSSFRLTVAYYTGRAVFRIHAGLGLARLDLVKLPQWPHKKRPNLALHTNPPLILARALETQTG